MELKTFNRQKLNVKRSIIMDHFRTYELDVSIFTVDQFIMFLMQVEGMSIDEKEI
jgi:hypothetical protein